MEWESSGGPPDQLSVGNKLITKASLIASAMNQFFIEKVKNIRNGIPHLENSFAECKSIMKSKTCKLGLSYVSLSKSFINSLALTHVYLIFRIIYFKSKFLTNLEELSTKIDYSKAYNEQVYENI